MKTFPSTAEDVFQNRSLGVCIYVSFATLGLTNGRLSRFTTQIWLIGSAITDVVIAMTMTVLVRQGT